MEVLNVVHSAGLARPDIFEPAAEFVYNGYPCKYHSFVWKDFFDTVWPRALAHWKEHQLPVYGESLDQTTAKIGEGVTDSLSAPGTFWSLYAPLRVCVGG